MFGGGMMIKKKEEYYKYTKISKNIIVLLCFVIVCI
jgi:hypothetical protein